MYFEGDCELEKKVNLLDNLYVYSARKRNDSLKQREIFQISVYYAETDSSHFYKLHVSRVYKQYQIGNKISRYTESPEKPRIIGNVFSCTVSKRNSAVRFGPKGNLGMLSTEHRNRGLGRFCMAYLVRRLISKGYGGYGVSSPSLSNVDAQDEHDKFVRNYFYSNSGFNFGDINIESGSCSAPTVLDLSSSHNRSKIRQITPERAAKLLLNELDKTTELEKKLENRERRIRFFKYTEEQLSQKYSTAMFFLTILIAYVVWTLPVDLAGRLLFIVAMIFVSYLFFFRDVKKWVRNLLTKEH